MAGEREQIREGTQGVSDFPSLFFCSQVLILVTKSLYQNHKDKFSTIFNALGDGDVAIAVAIKRGRPSYLAEVVSVEDAATARRQFLLEFSSLSPEEVQARKAAFVLRCMGELTEQDIEAADVASCILNCISPEQYQEDIRITRECGLEPNGTRQRSCWGSCMVGFDANAHTERVGSEDDDTQAISYGSESGVPLPPGAYDFAFPRINNGAGIVLESREGVVFMWKGTKLQHGTCFPWNEEEETEDEGEENFLSESLSTGAIPVEDSPAEESSEEVPNNSGRGMVLRSRMLALRGGAMTSVKKILRLRGGAITRSRGETIAAIDQPGGSCSTEKRLARANAKRELEAAKETVRRGEKISFSQGKGVVWPAGCALSI